MAPRRKATPMPPQPDIELSEKQIEFLRQVNVASTLKEWMNHPGYALYTGIVAELLTDVENQHLNFTSSATDMPSRDAYWAAGIRLGGIRQFAKVLNEEIAKRVGLLAQPLRPPQPPDPADFDGDNNATDN
jgi:hypothetical protein